MAATTLNFISGRPIFVTGQDPNPQRPVYPHARNWVSLCLVVHTRRRVLYRDRDGALHTIREYETSLAPVREQRFHASRLEQPAEMGSILCRALDLEEIDDNSAYRLATRLYDYVYDTGSLDLIAEFEVVCNDIVVGQEEGIGGEEEELETCSSICLEEEEEEEELEMCSICLDDLGGNDTIRSTCSHRFHESCFVQWTEKKNSCPLCRTELCDWDWNYVIDE